MPTYLKISDVSGTSKAPGRAVWLDVEEIAFGGRVRNDPSYGSGPAGIEDVSVLHQTDRASLELYRSFLNGHPHAEAVIQFVAKGKTLFTFTMKKVVIRAVIPRPSGDYFSLVYESSLVTGNGSAGFSKVPGWKVSAASAAGP